jgi:hypothetical protein
VEHDTESYVSLKGGYATLVELLDDHLRGGREGMERREGRGMEGGV